MIPPPRRPAADAAAGSSVVLAALAAAGRAESAAAAAAAAKLGLAQEVVGDGYEEFAACEVAAELSVSSPAAKNLAHLGDVLVHRLPQVRRASERGDLDLVRARATIDRTQAVTDPARDLHCRFPGCTSPAATADLVIPFNQTHPYRDGRTVATNLACLCR
ncbi:MAG: DUF222 domain-containing protein [Mycobacteriaceae bacterium]